MKNLNFKLYIAFFFAAILLVTTNALGNDIPEDDSGEYYVLADESKLELDCKYFKSDECKH